MSNTECAGWDNVDVEAIVKKLSIACPTCMCEDFNIRLLWSLKEGEMILFISEDWPLVHGRNLHNVNGETNFSGFSSIPLRYDSIAK